jgi:hypothetical protein
VYLVSAVLYLIVLLLHASLVSFLLLLNSGFMLTSLTIHLHLEDLSALVFTSLQLLEEGSVFKHFRAVLIPLHFHFCLLIIEKFFALVGVIGLYLTLMLFKGV